MNISPWTKSLVLFAATLTIVGLSFAFVLLHHEDRDNRIAFSLTNQDGDRVSEKTLAGKNLLVFFGFTSCRDICPAQMSKLSNVMNALDKLGHSNQITPVFISVDPERDNFEKVALYLNHFHSSFVGLTGSRPALQAAADRFKTLLEKAPNDPVAGYQLTHSSIFYIVDPYSRIIDFVPFAEPTKDIVSRVRGHL